MILGRERDGVFVDAEAINAYEFTTSGLKSKAQKDAEKLVEVLHHLGRNTENKYKSKTGWLVTESEPTAEQREAVVRIASASQITLHILSFQALRSRLCNVEEYLASRSQAPFGSTAYTMQGTTASVEPAFHEGVGTAAVGVRDLASRLQEAKRILLVGEFGVGKSFSLREIYRELRKRYFKSPATNPFPLHLNLRDAAGLRSPAEVLRRHAEEIGFPDDRGLISAWRAGACTLVLDGFDEVIPNRWLGSATDLKEVRWEALHPVRRLVAEAPPSTGVIVAGRGHYFSSEREMQQVLGLHDCDTLRMQDFDETQANELLRQSGIDATLPVWLPMRPLLLVHLLQHNALSDVVGIDSELDPAAAWRKLLSMICVREANVYASVSPDTIRRVVQRLATVARTKGDPLAPLNRSDLEQVFFDVSGRSTDQEVMQLLLRLPGLAIAQSSDEGEARVFADEDVAATAFGENLSEYLVNPYHGNLLNAPASWSDSADGLAIDVCAASLREYAVPASQVLAACDHRMDHHFYDAILMDGIRVADELGANAGAKSYRIEGVLIRELSVGEEAQVLSKTHLKDCVIETLDLGQLQNERDCATFDQCLIGQVQGASELPASISSRFPATEVGSFVPTGATTAGILSLNVGHQERVALSVLHKVYAKRGRGRKDSALPRGLDTISQSMLPDVLSRLLSANLISKSTRGTTTVYFPVKGAYAPVARWLESPHSFHLDDLAL